MMITEHAKRRVAITLAIFGGAIWLAEMVYLGGLAAFLKTTFWP